MFTIGTILSKIHNFWRKKCSVPGEKMVGLEIFFPPFLTFYRFTRTAQWYFVKGVDLKVPHTEMLACSRTFCTPVQLGISDL